MLPDLTLPDEVSVRGRGKGRAIHGAALSLSQLVSLLAVALGHKTIDVYLNIWQRNVHCTSVHVYMVHSMPGVVSSWQLGMYGDQQDRVNNEHVYMVYIIPGVVSSWQVGMYGDQQDRVYNEHVYMVYIIPGVVSS